MKSVVYIGIRGQDGRVKVYLSGDKDDQGNYLELTPPEPKDPAQERRFDWGHAGPGAYLLAHTILTHFLDDAEAAGRAAPHLLKEAVSKFQPGQFVLLNWRIEELLNGFSGNGSYPEKSLQNDK